MVILVVVLVDNLHQLMNQIRLYKPNVAEWVTAQKVKAVETVDRELGRIYREVKQKGGALLVTADHGNAELMIDPATGGPHTAHTTNPVPFILVTDAPTGTVSLRTGGSLRDISPTILSLLNLGQPKDMTGGDLRVIAGA